VGRSPSNGHGSSTSTSSRLRRNHRHDEKLRRGWSSSRRASRSTSGSVTVAQRPRQPAGQVVEVTGQLPRVREGAERGGEHPPRSLGEAPRQREAERGSLGTGDGVVELVIRNAKEDARVGSKIAEL